jgi:hypothetical protein
MRLRARYPDVKIAVGRWGLGASAAKDREQLQEAGVDYLGVTLQETRSQLVEFVHVERHRADPERVETARAEAVAPV